MQHFSRPVHDLMKDSKLSVTNRLLATLINGWRDICGPDFADITLPYKIVWAKKQHQQEDEKKQATLHILCPDALKTRILFQEAVWLDRCNRLIGNDLFNRMQTRHHDDWERQPKPIKKNQKIQLPDEYKDMMDGIDDPDLRRALERISQAIARSGQ